MWSHDRALGMQVPATAKAMGKQARLHVEARFSRSAFGIRLNDIMQDLTSEKLE